MTTVTIPAQRTNLFMDEVESQWIRTVAARNQAWRAGDTWLAELLDGRLDDLRDLVRRSSSRTTMAV